MDSESKNGFVSTVWGPATWHYLHVMSLAFPNDPTYDERRAYLTFVQSLCNVLPCRSCREGLVQNLARVPLRSTDLRDRPSFAHWMYRLHDEVNRMLHKESTLSFVQVCSRHINARVGHLCITRAQSPPRARDARDVGEWTCEAEMVDAIVEHDETSHRKWNDAFWLFVHCVSFNYPPEPTHLNRVQYQQFFTALIRTTPPSSTWSRCLRSIVLDPTSNWTISPERFENRRVLAEWAYNVHGELVKYFRQMGPLAPFDAFRDSYERLRANCTGGGRADKEHGGCVRSARGAPQQCVVNLH